MQDETEYLPFSSLVCPLHWPCHALPLAHPSVHQSARRDEAPGRPVLCQHLHPGEWGALLDRRAKAHCWSSPIQIRSFFRVAEMAEGYNGKLYQTEREWSHVVLAVPLLAHHIPQFTSFSSTRCPSSWPTPPGCSCGRQATSSPLLPRPPSPCAPTRPSRPRTRLAKTRESAQRAVEHCM